MENVALGGSIATTADCRIPPLSSYSVKYPQHTSLTVKSFKNAVDFNPKEKQPCKNTWYRDLKSTHIRNERLLDLPFREPKCCSDIYNICIDRRKLKKVQRYGLTRPVRTLPNRLEPEVVERCIPIKEGEATIFPECYILSESSSEEEEDQGSYDIFVTDSLSECSGCSTLGGGLRRRVHKVLKPGWRELLHREEEELCEKLVAEEFRKHKLGRDFQLKLDKIL